MDPSIDWKRVRGALFQKSHRESFAEARVLEVLDVLPKIIALCGNYSQSRKMAVRIGQTLLAQERPEIIVPTCPAYPHRGGHYHRIWTLGSGVSLLTRLHIPLLEQLVTLIPSLRVTILIADTEAEDRVIRKATGLTREAFIARVHSTEAATQACVKANGWDVKLLTHFMPTFFQDRQQTMQWIVSKKEFHPQIRADTETRRPFYKLYYPNGSFHRMMDRTIKVAADYMVLGCEAAKRNIIIVNHTTTSLAWYLRTEAAFLHNPIRAY